MSCRRERDLHLACRCYHAFPLRQWHETPAQPGRGSLQDVGIRREQVFGTLKELIRSLSELVDLWTPQTSDVDDGEG
jgi:hypothetical protein